MLKKFDKEPGVRYYTDLDFKKFSIEKFIRYSLVLGCNYLESTSGIGVVKAYDIVLHHDDLEHLFKRLEAFRKDIEDYKVGFEKAYETYKYALVFYPIDEKLKNLRPLPHDGKEGDYLGVRISHKDALAIANLYYI